jgi:hypothetical protein
VPNIKEYADAQRTPIRVFPPKIRSLVEKEAKRRKRSRSAIVSEEIQLYFRLRLIGTEEPTDEERTAVAEGKRAYELAQPTAAGAQAAKAPT